MQTWSYSVPEREGWYWWQHDDADGLHVVYVYEGTDGRMHWADNCEDTWYREPGDACGRWCPVPAPNEHAEWPAALATE